MQSGYANLLWGFLYFCYQSCESADWEKSLAFQITEQIRNYLIEDLAERDCPRGEIDWAEFEAYTR